MPTNVTTYIITFTSNSIGHLPRYGIITIPMDRKQCKAFTAVAAGAGFTELTTLATNGKTTVSLFTSDGWYTVRRSDSDDNLANVEAFTIENEIAARGRFDEWCQILETGGRFDYRAMPHLEEMTPEP